MFSLSFSYFCVVIFIFYEVKANIFINIDSDGEQSILGANFYYEDRLDNMTYEVRSLNRDNHLLRRELDTLNLKMDKELSAQNEQLLEIKKLLEQKVKKVSTKKAPTSCAEAMQSNSDHTHGGVYTLHLPDFPPFEVFCLKDPDNGPAWTIIQRRQDGTMDFFLKWNDYKNGFGNLYDEFWLGLDKIHALTKLEKQELWILLEDFEGETRYAKYNEFAVGDERSKYTMETLGNFSGNAGDSLVYHKGSKFSAKDSDNDQSDRTSCAVTYNGAWWFKKCSFADLNAPYTKNGDAFNINKSIEWYTWRGHYSLKHVHMAIRPVK